MAVPTPQELVEQFGRRSPETLATALGLVVLRTSVPRALPQVTVYSEYQPNGRIILYQLALRVIAEQRQRPLAYIEQWHIAHELYHALAEAHGDSPWRVRETAADLWADELMVLCSA